jgi:DNA-directed RNA polymerase subunit RPC12/RpoP
MKKLKEVKKDFCPAGCGAGFYPSGLFRPKEFETDWEYECQMCGSRYNIDSEGNFILDIESI